MAILITGGTGYIGSHTAVELIKAGHDIVILDNLSNSSAVVIERIQKITGKAPKFYPEDVRDGQALNMLFQENQIDAVIHFAGLKAVGESVEKPLAYYENNIGGTLHLLQAMKEKHVKKFVFSSSACVYGEGNKPPFTEDMPTSSINPYGWTKVMIEQILGDYCNADKDFKVVSLRYFNPVGAHESGLIGEDPKGIPNNLTPYITQVLIGKRDKLTVNGDDYPTPDGTCLRDYIHVVDLARGHVLAMEYMAKAEGFSVFNLGTGRGESVLDVIHAFEKATGKNIPYVIGPRRPNNADAPISLADVKKAEEYLNFRAKYSMVEMCKDAWRWQQENPEGYR